MARKCAFTQIQMANKKFDAFVFQRTAKPIKEFSHAQLSIKLLFDLIAFHSFSGFAIYYAELCQTFALFTGFNCDWHQSTKKYFK